MKPIPLLVISVFILLSGCTHKIKESEPAPPDLIPKDQMVDILIDLRLMDAVLNSKQRIANDGFQDTLKFYYGSVMEKHGITRERFDKSITYYQRDLKVMDELYEEAITRLSKLKTEESQKEN